MEIKGKVFTKGQKQGEETPTVAEETSYLLSLCLPTWRLFVSSQAGSFISDFACLWATCAPSSSRSVEKASSLI